MPQEIADRSESSTVTWKVIVGVLGWLVAVMVTVVYNAQLSTSIRIESDYKAEINRLELDYKSRLAALTLELSTYKSDRYTPKDAKKDNIIQDVTRRYEACEDKLETYKLHKDFCK